MLDEILKEKFGEDVVIKKFEKSKKLVEAKNYLALSQAVKWINLANILEERSIWQRYGF